MTGEKATWAIRLAAAAFADLDDIVDWTADRFGESQARSYAALLNDAILALAGGPTAPGVRARPEIGRDLFTLHAGRGTSRARHLILFRVRQRGDGAFIEVLRVLHDAMDLTRHVPPPAENKR